MGCFKCSTEGTLSLDHLSWVLILLQIVTDQITREDRMRDLWAKVENILEFEGLGIYKDKPRTKRRSRLFLTYVCFVLRRYPAEGFGGILFMIMRHGIFVPRYCPSRDWSHGA